jgi:hypothetical protein
MSVDLVPRAVRALNPGRHKVASKAGLLIARRGEALVRARPVLLPAIGLESGFRGHDQRRGYHALPKSGQDARA